MNTLRPKHENMMHVLLNTKIDARVGTLVILYYSIIMESLIYMWGFPGVIRYLNDVILIIVLWSAHTRFINSLKKQRAMLVFGAIVALLTFDLLTAAINFVPLNLVAWAFRNTFRGVIYFLCVLSLVRVEDTEWIFKSFFYLQWPNLALAVYQYLFMSMGGQGDYVHGFFANGAGTNTFNAVLAAYFVAAYIKKKVSIWSTGFIIVSGVIIAVLAEEKTYFLYLSVIFIVTLLINNWSVRTGLIIIFIVVVSVLMFNWIMNVQSSMLDMFINPDETKKYLTSTWSNSYGIPRIGAFTFISSYFFNNDIVRELVGFGFGYTEYGQFSFLQSDFSHLYKRLMYRSFTHQWVFLETGYIGFILLVCVFLAIIICLSRNILFHVFDVSDESQDLILKSTAICIAICCIISMWSNATLKLDAAYIPYFGVALGFLSHTTKKDITDVKVN